MQCTIMTSFKALFSKYCVLICIVFSLPGGLLKAQNNLPQQAFNEDQIKHGFAFGGTPILAYDSDLGLRYGAVINLFDYGTGDNFPNYLQYAYIKLFHSTKGTSNYSIVFDSKKILPRSKVLLEASYMNDIALDFFGFNGTQTVVNANIITRGSSEFKNPFYYTHSRSFFRIRADVQKPIFHNHLRLYLGANYNKINIDAPKWNKLLSSDELKTLSTESLYHAYTENGLIKESQENGGDILHFSLGFIYDSRDNLINCKNGTWIESYLLASPGIKTNPSFAKHIFSYRHYRQLGMNTVMLFRLSSQQKIFGEIPFYYLPQYFDSRQNQDGIGGAFTARGINRNRITANGFLLSNLEIRQKLTSLQLFKLNWDIEFSVFTDASFVTQEYNNFVNDIPIEIINQYHNKEVQKINYSIGPGLYFIYNTNNIISLNLGISPNKQLGSNGLYIGSSFLF